jgi:hypothetical protein
MPSPPDIEKPFASAKERREAHAEFVRLAELARQIVLAADGAVTPPAWLATELTKPLRGFQEPPEIRLQRYRSLFAEELEALGEALSTERERPLDDASLRTARYLAQRLLASLLDSPVGDLGDRLPNV